MEEELFSNVILPSTLNLDLVFWDTTSTYFQGEGPELSFQVVVLRITDLIASGDRVLMTKDGFLLLTKSFLGTLLT